MTPYAHAQAVATLLAGYPGRVMPDHEERAIARVLKARQAERAKAERRDAERASERAESETHRRRAEKAAYLRDKLAEAERSS